MSLKHGELKAEWTEETEKVGTHLYFDLQEHQ